MAFSPCAKILAVSTRDGSLYLLPALAFVSKPVSQLFHHPRYTPSGVISIVAFSSVFVKVGRCNLFCFVLFCLVLFGSVLFCSVWFCLVLFCFVLFCSVLFCSVLFCSVLFCSVLFCSVLFCSVVLHVALPLRLRCTRGAH